VQAGHAVPGPGDLVENFHLPFVAHRIGPPLQTPIWVDTATVVVPGCLPKNVDRSPSRSGTLEQAVDSADSPQQRGS
jgi:hypothetical protein